MEFEIKSIQYCLVNCNRLIYRPENTHYKRSWRLTMNLSHIFPLKYLKQTHEVLDQTELICSKPVIQFSWL